MNHHKAICGLCYLKIQKGQPVYYFPRLHTINPLADIKGVLHVACLKGIDTQRNVAQLLADTYESMLYQSKQHTQLIMRDGNIILGHCIHEDSIEFYNFEDFCQFSISMTIVITLKDIKKDTFILINKGMSHLHVGSEGALVIEDLVSTARYELTSLNLLRLCGLIKILKESGKN